MSDEEHPYSTAGATPLSTAPLGGAPLDGGTSSEGSSPPVRWLGSNEPLTVPGSASAIVLFQKIPDQFKWRYSAFVSGKASLPIASGDVFDRDVILAILPDGQFDSREQMALFLNPLLCDFLAKEEGEKWNLAEGPPVVWS